MALGKDETRDLYRRRAPGYDLAVQLYRLAGFRVRHYREEAVRALALRAGDTVVEIGCGTGLNFPWLEKAVGHQGRIVGVDLTDAMLQEARERVRREGWTNVEIVLDVPAGTTKLAFGFLMSGRGRMWVEDLRLEVVGPQVPSTNMYPDSGD